ncbi:MAG: HAMP domain-containing protein [Clostridia bacterium]|nr:HAMP domain-containing protein [Clostridia bacterium]
MTRSLQVKLVMILVLLIVTVMTVIGIYLLNSVGTYYEDRFYDEMGDVFTGDFLDVFRDVSSGEDGLARAEEYLLAHSSQLGLNPSRTFALLDARTGAYLTGSDPDGVVEKTNNVLAALAGKVGMDTAISTDYFDIAVPVADGDGGYIIYICDNKESVSELQQMLLSAVLQALLFGLVIAVLLSVMLAKTISRPIENLTRSAKLVAAGDFTSKPPAYSGDEIGVLTQTFNDMSQALEDTLDAVANERNKLSAVFEHMTDGIVALSRRGELLHINAAAQTLLATDGSDYDSLQSPLTMEEVLAIESGKAEERIAKVNSRDLRFFFTPFGNEEHEGGVIIVIYDITEQERLNTARREFVADISHELRTPLTNVRSYAETILSDDEMPPAIRARFMQVILNETDRMTRLVRDLLTISKLDYGRMDWHLNAFVPEELIKNIVDAAQMEAKKRNQTLSLAIETALPTISADYDRLGQVYMNIITNAIKYTPNGGEIRVSARLRDGGAEILVADNGMGIPKNDLPHIFDRFYRVDKARSRESGGSGLGLAIAKEFIQNLNGTIRIESEQNVGTTVAIWLPAADGGTAV